ncbi:MAG: dihydropteroate synthase [Thermodesulfobacteriota bacterium]|nr:dihydropteroate synthase [Thermodesulfobacteriota bacterium]
MAPYTYSWGRFALEFGRKTLVMGILNTTPDSFSDGGRFFSLDAAIAHGQSLVDHGADILDIGGESTRPFSMPVSVEEEIARVVPVIEGLSKKINIPISIDTHKAAVAEAALDAGAAMINDISALEKDPDMAVLAGKRKVPVVLMHMQGTPETMQIAPRYTDVVEEIRDYLAQRAEYAVQSGVSRDAVIIDPGIGFGKTVNDNLLLIKHLEKIKALGFPVLMGPSRKSFIQKKLSAITGREINAASREAELGTLAAVAVSAIHHAQIVRVHDVADVKPVVQMIDAIQNA